MTAALPGPPGPAGPAGAPGPARQTGGSRSPVAARPHVTGRAAILAVVLAAVALSLAYPVREYIAQRRQIDQLRFQAEQIAQRVKQLQARRRQLADPAYIERLARDRLHMCLPSQQCFEVIAPPARPPGASARRTAAAPWYARLWASVRRANREPPGSRRPGRRPQARAPGGARSG